MRLPDIFSEDKGIHLTLLFLGFANLLLLVVFFFVSFGPGKNFPGVVPISSKIPVIRLGLISPSNGSTVSGLTPLIMTLSNSPTIQKAELQVDGKIVQTVFTQTTGKLTLFWDTTKQADGTHRLVINATDQKGKISNVNARFEVRNNASRSVSNR